MKKKIKWASIPIVLIITFFLFKKSPTHDEEVDSRKLSHFNQQAKDIENKKPSVPTRAIASIKEAKVKRKVAQVMDKKMFKDKIKKRSKSANPSGYRYRSISPNQGSDFNNGVGNYKFLDYFYAIKNTPENRTQFPNAQEKLDFLIVESDLPLVDSLPVVENADTGNLGIFLGVLNVKLHDLNDADFVIGHSDYEILKIHSQTNLVQYTIDDIAIAIKTNQQLQSNPKVIRASLEILEYQRRPI